jgi:hypothetical protein
VTAFTRRERDVLARFVCCGFSWRAATGAAHTCWDGGRFSVTRVI